MRVDTKKKRANIGRFVRNSLYATKEMICDIVWDIIVDKDAKIFTLLIVLYMAALALYFVPNKTTKELNFVSYTMPDSTKEYVIDKDTNIVYTMQLNEDGTPVTAAQIGIKED